MHTAILSERSIPSVKRDRARMCMCVCVRDTAAVAGEYIMLFSPDFFFLQAAECLSWSFFF